MLNKISTVNARKKFVNIINQVAYGKESFVLTRRGEALDYFMQLRAFCPSPL